MLNILFRLLFLLMLAWAGTARADLVLIANPESAVDNLSREEAINIYMGRLRRFPSGAAAQPLDLPSGETEKALFYRLLVNKDLSDIEAYWARLVFSGRASPPRTVSNLKEVVERVAKEPNVIGYIDRTLVDKRVRIIMELQAKGTH
jgi:ABC-type phosphate transport system substrate-binding protein